MSKLLTILFCGSVLLGLAPAAQAQITNLVNYNHTWRYNNSGTDLGVAWRAVGYDDSSWAAGSGVLSTAGEALLQGATIGTTWTTTTPGGIFITNIYLRTTFTISGPTNGMVLYATNQIDDGAVIYLNGVEVGRFAMPAGTPTSTTFATRANDISEAAHGVEVLTITSNFVSGVNTLAVELHQGNAGSSDITFGMRLVGVNPVAPTITQQPVSQSSMPSNTVIFSVSATGTPTIGYQWRSNGVNIANARSSTFSIANIQPHYAANYSVVVSNAWGAVTSSVARLDVGCFTAPSFSFLPPDLNTNTGGTISLPATATGTIPIRYQWYKGGVPIPNAINATYTKFNAQPADSAFYYVVASNCMGMVTSAPIVVAVAQPTYSIVGITSHNWKYNATGTDLGSAWRQPSYNDSAWPTGRGVFGLESAALPSPINTPWSLRSPSDQYITTYYLRTTFVLTNDVEAVSLISSNVFDDGIVVYLNGTEIYRMNMRNGPVSYSTLAPGTIAEGTFLVTNFPPAVLVKGTNYLAVEVHQASLDSSDIVFGMQVNVVYPYPSPIVITDQPVSQNIEETKITTLTLGHTGEPAYYRWYKDGVLIPGATTNPFRIQITDFSDAGNYYVVATNVINSVTSSVAAITVYADTNKPVIVDAFGTPGPTNVIVSFSELVLPSTATNLANYRITNAVNGQNLNITKAVLVDGTNVWLTTQARAAGTNYILIVNGVKDISIAQNEILPNSRMPIASLFSSVIPFNAIYSYYQPQYALFDPSPDQGTAWKEVDFTVPAYWAGGPGGFLYTTSPYETPYTVGRNLGQSELITSYYRTTFNTTATPSGSQLVLTHFLDDGAVFYLNGVEVYRANMRPGAVDYLTRPSLQVGAGSLSEPIILPEGLLRTGDNVLAVELHQIQPLDSDAAFAMQVDLKARSILAGPVVITSGPQDQTVMEGQTATFEVTQAAGTTYQWRRNGVNITGATNRVLQLANVPLSFSNSTISVVVGNSTGTATSPNATLRVVPDTERPTLVGAILTGNTITVSFSEPVSLPSATTLANYRVTNFVGQTRVISSAQLVNGTNVVLNFASLPITRYVVVVSNVRDATTATNVILSNSAVIVGLESQVVTMGGTWKYHDIGSDLGTAWRERTYNDSSWQSGSALLGVKRGDVPANIPEPLRTTLIMGNDTTQYPTYYFRTTFNSFAAANADLTFSTILDDGAVIYLNGVEVQRIGMSAGVVDYNTVASRTVGDTPPLEGPFTVRVGNIVDGVNVIAVEVHQVNLTSSDLYWAGEFSLSIKPEVIPAPIPPTNSCPFITYNAPTLNYQRPTTNTIQFTWTNPITNEAPCSLRATYALEAALTLTNPVNNTVWVNLGTNSPTTITNATSSRFFRLRRL